MRVLSLKAQKAMLEEERIARMEFERIDTNHDGAITLNELMMGLSKLGYTPDEIRILFEDVDTNQNSKIEIDEWTRYKVAVECMHAYSLARSPLKQFIHIQAHKAGMLHQGLGKGRKPRPVSTVCISGRDSNQTSKGVEISAQAEEDLAESEDAWGEVFALLLIADYSTCLQVLWFSL